MENLNLKNKSLCEESQDEMKKSRRQLGLLAYLQMKCPPRHRRLKSMK